MATSYLVFEASPGDEFTGTVTGGTDWCDFYVRPDNSDAAELLEQLNTYLNGFYDQVRLIFLMTE